MNAPLAILEQGVLEVWCKSTHFWERGEVPGLLCGVD